MDASFGLTFKSIEAPEQLPAVFLWPHGEAAAFTFTGWDQESSSIAASRCNLGWQVLDLT